MRGMIALVSGQRMQNIIPCYQDGVSFAEVHLVRSREADDPWSPHARARADTRAVLEQVTKVFDVEPAVDAFDVAAVREAVRRVAVDLKSRGLEPVVNFTGGTKCMAVGAYLAAVDAGCACVYVDTDNERLVWYSPNGLITPESFALKEVDIRLYLKAYGLTMSGCGKQKRSRKLSGLVHLIKVLWPGCVPHLETWTEEVKDKKKGAVLTLKGAPGLFRESLVKGLVNNGLLVWESGYLRPTDDGVRFLSGEWLELIVYDLLCQGSATGRKFTEVLWQVKLAGVENELDVAATGWGRFIVIECKSGDPGGQDTLNKLQALRQRLGLFARMCFVSSLPEKEIPVSFRERALEYGIRDIISRENLINIAEILTQTRH